VFVCFDDTAALLDIGPLGRAIDAYPLESMELVLSETDDRRFNWKVLLENYSENYHTPFVHPEIDNRGKFRIKAEITNVQEDGQFLLFPGKEVDLTIRLDIPATAPASPQFEIGTNPSLQLR